VIHIPARFIADTFTIFRDCGGSQRECIVYWLGPVNLPDTVDEIVHPHHISNQNGYEIDDRWLTDFWFELARRQKSVRIQLHTHPHEAFHSTTDNHWALIHTSGFLSLVIPDYATGSVSLDRAFLTERTDRGWREVPLNTQLHIFTEGNS
jgi:proteasome lid subunit RPN8/RPN11